MFLLVSVWLATVGCGSTGVTTSEPSIQVPIAPDCRVARTTGDVSGLLRSDGDVVIVGGGLELLRSGDLGGSWRREVLPVTCRWPDLVEIEGRLLVSCSERRPPSRLLVFAETPDGNWSEPIVVAATGELFIDTNLQVTGAGDLLLFATHIDRPGDLDDAVYTIRTFRSGDGGKGWSADGIVAKGRRGVHLEDLRSVELDDGSLLLVYEHEKTEAEPSRLLQLRSTDLGRTWSDPDVVWQGSDLEPGGYVRFDDGELWLVVSSDVLAGGGSYDRATIMARRSTDDGRSWSQPIVLVNREDQISFGGVVIPGEKVLLPSLRHYSQRKQRSLSVYVVDRNGAGGAAGCALTTLSRVGFEGEVGPQR